MLRSPASPRPITFPFWLTLCLLLSLGSVGVLGTVPVLGQSKRQNAEQKLLQRKDGDRHVALAQAAARARDLQTAQFHWQQAAAIYRHWRDWEKLNATWTALAQVYRVQDNLQAAETVLRQQLHLARDRQDQTTQITVLNQLGQLLEQQAQPQVAAAIFADAVAIAQAVSVPGKQEL
ncbi:tetratricopeptide repeat protein [Synechococcus moorigangaii CMS01]|nr:tetratricopeptide repeat protein [Synechococcus moorigangaii CMS01]